MNPPELNNLECVFMELPSKFSWVLENTHGEGPAGPGPLTKKTPSKKSPALQVPIPYIYQDLT